MKDLPENLGEEAPINRYNAHAFVYVLEGSVVMQLKGEQQVTLHQDRSSMKDLMMFVSSTGTQATPSQRNFLFS